MEVVEAAQHQSIEGEYSLKPESCKLLKPQEILIPSEDDYSRSPPREYDDIRQGFFLDDGGFIVEELTVKSYNGSSLDIGTSNNRERLYNKQNQWRHLYQLSDSGVGNSPSHAAFRNNVQAASNAWVDIGSTSFPELLAKKSVSDDHSNVMEHLTTAENKQGAGDVHGGIRTKMISKSGFSEYFIKHTLKGKGIICRGPSSDGRDQNQMKVGIGTARMDSNVSLSSGPKTEKSSSYSPAISRSDGANYDGMTLREWLKLEHQNLSKAERLYIFRKIVDLVDSFHSQEVALHNLCPSYIKLLPSNQVMYLGLPISTQIIGSVVNSEALPLEESLVRKRATEQGFFPSLDTCSKKQKFNENVTIARGWSQFPRRSDSYFQPASDSKINAVGSRDYCNKYEEDIQLSKHGAQKMSSIPCVSDVSQLQLTSVSERLEDTWYTGPEGGCTRSSNIYCLGVLLFELLGHFDSEGARIAAMSDLQNRILPPCFLSENPKEAGFCLWLLHPKPSSRPTTREILQSEVINGLQEVYSEDMSSSIDQEDAESEILLHFLISLKDQKQNDASKLVEDIRCLESDIEDVERRHSSRKSLVSSGWQNESSCPKEKMLPSTPPISNGNEFRLMKNISQLESAYFSMRSKIQIPETGYATHPDKDLLRNRENCFVARKDEEKHRNIDPMGIFFDGLCKYARYSKFEVRGVLRNADFNNPANVICSLSFDRDEDYFAAAGVSKKIKIFEFNALFSDSVDIHYPVAEMSNKSKLSCVCWNNYIKNYLASTDYDGAVKLWDASTGQAFSEFTEHGKRAWSVDFSPVCPTKFASGSDDCSVKLWNISERNCLGTIRNVANVCCVQFSSHSSHLLAFGSADYITYCYDLRNLRSPWCVLVGHDKAVSYVKFLDSETLVSASTDNTLKIWDLNKTSSVDSSPSACSLTLSGHTNEKNFVGLSVADGYIACGSETNEVYAYYRSLPMPITSHKFGSMDPISGRETDDDNGQFVSSVCWRGKSDMVIAANSSGCIKVLQMV
ncbi:protein SPA1-RELATED 2-like [Senna tora]|uniref:Protein SPA1-RELATED 2-like n=1 Tax=Senna tora TaxID=362788 RepID=A0A834SYM1_9FABA|nr:protein SPA1-RELATED 2-like [Senna tora]